MLYRKVVGFSIWVMQFVKKWAPYVVLLDSSTHPVSESLRRTIVERNTLGSMWVSHPPKKIKCASLSLTSLCCPSREKVYISCSLFPPSLPLHSLVQSYHSHLKKTKEKRYRHGIYGSHPPKKIKTRENPLPLSLSTSMPLSWNYFSISLQPSSTQLFCFLSS